MGGAARPLIVVAGVDKAGSSSLAWGLIGHPDVTMVEEGPPGEDLRPLRHRRTRPRPPGDALAIVLRDNRLFADPAAPARIARLEPVSVMVSLREPVARVASMYRHRRALGRLPVDLTLDEFARCQLEGGAPAAIDYRVVSEGRYAPFLESWFDEVGPDRVEVVFLEEWRADPQGLVRRVVTDAGLDVERLSARGPDNESGDARFPRVSRAAHLVGRKIEIAGARRGRREQVQRYVRPALRRLYTATLVTDRPGPGFSPEMHRRLLAYYRDENEHLAELLGRPLPWSPDPESASGVATTAH